MRPKRGPDSLILYSSIRVIYGLISKALLVPQRGNRILNFFHLLFTNKGCKPRTCSGMKSCLVNIPATGDLCKHGEEFV